MILVTESTICRAFSVRPVICAYQCLWLLSCPLFGYTINYSIVCSLYFDTLYAMIIYMLRMRTNCVWDRRWSHTQLNGSTSSKCIRIMSWGLLTSKKTSKKKINSPTPRVAPRAEWGYWFFFFDVFFNVHSPAVLYTLEKLWIYCFFNIFFTFQFSLVVLGTGWYGLVTYQLASFYEYLAPSCKVTN